MSDVMRQVGVDKVVINIGVGEAGERLVKAEKVLEMVTGQKPVETISKTVNRDLGIRVGMPSDARSPSAERPPRSSSGRPSPSGRCAFPSTPSTRRATCPSVSPTTPTSRG